MNSIVPFIISFLTGYFFLRALLLREKPHSALCEFFLSWGVGFGINASLTFLSFLVWGKFHQGSILVINGLALTIVCAIACYRSQKHSIKLFDFKNFSILPVAAFLLISSVVISILILHGKTFPFGGWDAWSVWNLKAKFLFTADDWKVMLDPILWRASPHYPLLLPLINVWGWTFSVHPTPMVPLATSVIFCYLTFGLLFAGLKTRMKTLPAFFGGLLLVCLPFFIILGTSQYADIVVAYYLLGAVYCLLSSTQEKNQGLALLSGIFLGLLSFIKSEATIAAILLAILAVPYLMMNSKDNKKNILFFFAGLMIFTLPTIIFQIFYSPGNQTFINGLTSTVKPATWDRLRVIGLAFYLEFTKRAWGGTWILLLTGLLLARGRCFQKRLIIIPIFLITYLGIIGFYYFLNTYFEIIWWMSVTLNRILFSLLPTCILWVFLSVGMDKKEKAGCSNS